MTEQFKDQEVKGTVSKELQEQLQQELDTGMASPVAMSLACAIGLHNWNGSKKCVNCGATRG